MRTQTAQSREFLPKMVIYLSGAIEHAPDFGKPWRTQLTPRLRALGHEVYDPAADEQKNLTEEEVRNFRQWKRSDLEQFRRTVRKIIAWDMDWIERRADGVICYWDEHCSKGAGTQAELTAAYRRGVPVYLVAAMPVEQISGWILGCATEIFADFEELERFLRSEKSLAMSS
jgi:hypothetical protein